MTDFEKIRLYLLEHGFSSVLDGTLYIAECLKLAKAQKYVALPLHKVLYPQIARRNKITTATVERGIRYSIEHSAFTGTANKKCLTTMYLDLFGEE